MAHETSLIATVAVSLAGALISITLNPFLFQAVARLKPAHTGQYERE